MTATIVVGLAALFFTFLYDRKVCNWGFLFAMILLSVFCAIRYEWGTDMPAYAESFELYGDSGAKFWQLYKISNISIRANESNEIAWGILNVLCQPIGFFGMTMLLSFFESFAVYQFVKKYVPRGYFTLAVFLYVFNPNLMILGCSMMRQWLAMCLVLVAYIYLDKRKLWLFVLLVVLASLFHTSALVCLLIPLIRSLSKCELYGKKVLLFSILILAWVYVFGRYMGDILLNVFNIGRFKQYELYLSLTETASVGFGSMMNIIVTILCLGSLKVANIETKKITWAYSAYLFFLPFVTIIPLASRINFYFELFSVGVIPNGLLNNKHSLVKWFIVLWVLFWYIYMFIKFFDGIPWKYSYMEYHTIFEAPSWM